MTGRVDHLPAASGGIVLWKREGGKIPENRKNFSVLWDRRSGGSVLPGESGAICVENKRRVDYVPTGIERATVQSVA